MSTSRIRKRYVKIPIYVGILLLLVPIGIVPVIMLAPSNFMIFILFVIFFAIVVLVLLISILTIPIMTMASTGRANGDDFSVSKYGFYTDKGAKLQTCIFALQDEMKGNSLAVPELYSYNIAMQNLEIIISKCYTGKSIWRDVEFRHIALWKLLYNVNCNGGNFFFLRGIPSDYAFETENTTDSDEVILKNFALVKRKKVSSLLELGYH